jgi:hypothetical protein
MRKEHNEPPIIEGVDTHKDLRVAAIVDTQDHFLASEGCAKTRPGYRVMLEWMQSYGDLQRVGVEPTGTSGAGVLHHSH